MHNEDTRNTIIFVVLAALLLVFYQFAFIGPQQERKKADVARQAPPAASQATPAQVPQVVNRQAAIAASPRVGIETPALRGSLSLRGARLDDLYLVQYRQTVRRDAPPVELLRPEGTRYPFFAEVGWIGQNIAGLPDRRTVWTQTAGDVLAPGRPVTLSYSTGQGLTFTRQIAVDDKFMFTVTDTVANTGGQPVTLVPYGAVQRQGVPSNLGREQIVHEGGIGWLGKLRQHKYPKWDKDGSTASFPTTGGWVGITDKYWLAALIPGQQERFECGFRKTVHPGVEVFDAHYTGSPVVIPAGRQVTETTHLFAGAKRVPVLRGYEDSLGISHFDDAVDWGNFWFLTRPLFDFLDFIFRYVGTFGVAILLLTVVVRLVFFPLANKQYESLTKMKKVQPQMEELRKKYKDDPAKQQQELLALYQREKVNPLAGCLPILLQIPVFYALYKVLTVTIEMRHAPFMGWIKDLSARDPTTVWNLFGLIPWNPASVPLVGGLLDGPLHLGILPLLYGVTMWLTMSMSPPAPDPIQQRIFKLMPWIFMFIMAPFAVGLIIYWTWSNVLTGLQQYVIMRRFKVDNPIDNLIARFTGKPKAVG
jgi:YidC/Oxa1 family membrane protein insertase